MRLVLCLFLLGIVGTSPTFANSDVAPNIEQDSTAARIMVYFTVGRDEHPATNITIEQFKAHLLELTSGDYNVLPLPQVMKAYATSSALPPKTIVLTFDGGDKSVLQNAVPLLEEHKLPYTLFIAPKRADDTGAQYINWQELKELHKSGLATIGLHTENYSGISRKTPENIRLNINNATHRFRENMGFQPQFFAYPFGEYTPVYKNIIMSYGFKGAFGQQSGVAYAEADPHALPRFTMTENYGDERRFKMTANALPLPAQDITPDTPHINRTLPAIGFTVAEELTSELGRLSCFASGQKKPQINILENRIEMRLTTPIDQPRFRVNCTLPVETANETRWRWFGMLFTLK